MILNKIKALFFKKTVDGVVGKFSKTLNDLDIVQEQQNKELDKQSAKVYKHEKAAKEAASEAQRAAQVKRKLNDLLSAD